MLGQPLKSLCLLKCFLSSTAGQVWVQVSTMCAIYTVSVKLLHFHDRQRCIQHRARTGWLIRQMTTAYLMLLILKVHAPTCTFTLDNLHKSNILRNVRTRVYTSINILLLQRNALGFKAPLYLILGVLFHHHVSQPSIASCSIMPQLCCCLPSLPFFLILPKY